MGSIGSIGSMGSIGSIGSMGSLPLSRKLENLKVSYSLQLEKAQSPNITSSFQPQPEQFPFPGISDGPGGNVVSDGVVGLY